MKNFGYIFIHEYIDKQHSFCYLNLFGLLDKILIKVLLLLLPEFLLLFAFLKKGREEKLGFEYLLILFIFDEFEIIYFYLIINL